MSTQTKGLAVSNHIVHQHDIPDDPNDAWTAFTVAWRRYQMAPSSKLWPPVRAAYHELCVTLSPDQRRELRVEAKSAGRTDPLQMLGDYLKEADRQRARTPRAKAKRKALDANRAKDPKRQSALRKYKAAHRAKKKAEKLAQVALAAMEVA